MAVGADYKGLPAPSGHGLGPRGCARDAELGEFTDVVGLYLTGLLAEFAPACCEPADQLAAGVGDAPWGAVVDDCCFLPFEWDATEPCDQWFAVLSAVDHDFEACPRPVRRRDLRLVFGCDLRRRGAVL